MKTTFENIYFIDIERNIYDLGNNGKEVESIPADTEYAIVLDDNFFIYETIGAKIPKSSKIDMIVRNYLSGIYPENLIENFYIVKGEKVIAAIATNKFNELLKDKNEIFENASNVSTLAIEAYIAGQTLTLNYPKTKITVNSDGISYEPNDEKKYFSISNLKVDTINFNLLKKKTKINVKFAILTGALLSVIFIFYIFGQYYNVAKLNKDINYLNSKIDEIYKKANITDPVDPYGKLLFMAQKNTNSKKIYILAHYYNISKTMTENDIIDSLSFKDNTFTLTGKTKDFKSLDDIRNKLLKNYKTVDILNTKIEKDALIFTVRATL